MVTIFNCVCVGHSAEQTGSFNVKSSLYHLVMGCKMFHHKPVISIQSLKIIHQETVCTFQQCAALIFWVHVFQMLWSIIYCSSHFVGKLRSITTHTMAGLMYVRSEIWHCQRSAGERHGLQGCALWKLTKLETKYSMHKIAHAKHWKIHTSSLEGCIANRDCQTVSCSQKGGRWICLVLWWTVLCVILLPCAQWTLIYEQLIDKT